MSCPFWAETPASWPIDPQADHADTSTKPTSDLHMGVCLLASVFYLFRHISPSVLENYLKIPISYNFSRKGQTCTEDILKVSRTKAALPKFSSLKITFLSSFRSLPDNKSGMLGSLRPSSDTALRALWKHGQFSFAFPIARICMAPSRHAINIWGWKMLCLLYFQR